MDIMAGNGNKLLTLHFVRRVTEEGKKQVLLGMKKRGFGEGKWNGFGGKVEPGETIERAAVRELVEESEVVARNIRRRGRLIFTFNSMPTVMEVHVFETTEYEGVPAETEEMKPEWYDEESLPFDDMWADDRYWLPVLLRDRSVIDGVFHFDDESTLLTHKLDEVFWRNSDDDDAAPPGDSGVVLLSSSFLPVCDLP